jgi:hypothetical protein
MRGVRFGVAGAAWAVAGTAMAGDAQADVFAGPPAAYTERLVATPVNADAPLRTLSVEERVGVPRTRALVRVPLFFAPGECPSLDDLVIESTDAGGAHAAILWQADDVRRGPDGGIARAHLWFEADLQPGEKRQYRLIRQAGAPRGRAGTVMKVTASGETVQVETAAGAYEFSQDGGLLAVPGAGGGWHFGESGARPHVVLDYAATKTAPARRVELGGRSAAPVIHWAAGPLFAKLTIAFSAANGVALEQVYRVPRDGAELVLTEAVFPGEGGVVKENRLLAGTRLESAGELVRVPAGVRASLRGEHAYTVSAVPAKSGLLLAVPLVIGGTNGQWRAGAGGELTLDGQGGLQRGGEGEKDTLFAFWTEVRLVPSAGTAVTAAWQTYRAHIQPLVAVVEEPGASLDGLHAALADLIREMKPIGWRQEAGRDLALGDTSRLARLLATVSLAKEGDADSLIRGARNDTAKLTQNGQRRLREDEKGRAYGRIDPYHITYTQSAAAAAATLTDAPPTITAVNHAMAKAVRVVGGRADATGFPYIDCFSRTLNMQMGPVLFGLTAGARERDDDLVRFYRDLAMAPPVLGVFGRGQRPYTGAPAGSADQTDYLYQAICDFWLRTTELLANEDLQLHPLAYGRYTDCIDVNADRFHAAAAKDKPGAAGEVRANFFRGQAHTHRWLGWSAAPFIRLLQDPGERGAVGLTEAIRYARLMHGRWKNWPDLTFYELADVLVRSGLDRYRRPVRLAAVGPVTLQADAAGAALTWSPVAGAAEYRVYRAERAGGPYAWVNSPYTEPAGDRITQPRWQDRGGKSGASYVVVAVDAAGRPGEWPASP